ncbi:MAG: DNA polymerase III subunit beta [Trueperella sp.]|nr:DNA polymerase III subunit beta [Trueperella sp.]
MIITVEHDIFTEAVTWVARTIPNRPAVPVLAGMRIVAGEDSVVSLGSRDSDITSHIDIEATVTEPGEVLVNGKLLADICRSLPNKDITLQLDGGKLEISCGNSHFSMQIMTSEDYAELPELPPVIGTVDGAEWQEAVTQVSIAASNDDTLPMLVSICVEISGDKIALMATDRYRLAIREISWTPTNPDIETRFLVRASRLLDFAKALGTTGKVEISLKEEGPAALIGFSTGGMQNTIQLIDGEYPQVRSLFPNEVEGHAVMERQEILEAIKRSRLVAEKNSSVRLSFSAGEVLVEAGQRDSAQASEVLPAQLTGEEINMAFNPLFLQEGFGVIGEKDVRLSFTQATKPAVLVGEEDGEVNNKFRLLLMPIRTVSAN